MVFVVALLASIDCDEEAADGDLASPSAGADEDEEDAIDVSNEKSSNRS